jgi:hypothetical protein
MAFKVKDLMINYLPTQAQVGRQPVPPCLDPPLMTCGCSFCSLCTQACTEGCTACTQCTQCTHCTNCTVCTHCTHCTACTLGCTNHLNPLTICAVLVATHCTAHTCNFGSACGPFASLAPAGPVEGEASRLSALKQQLAAQLAEVEKQEKAAEEELRPKTVAELDELQKKLQEAIDELKTRRPQLEQQEKKEKSK